MFIITRIPHSIKTRISAVSTYRNFRCAVEFIGGKYHVSKVSLMRWNLRYDGTVGSLEERSRQSFDCLSPSCLTSFSNIRLSEFYLHLQLNSESN